MYYLETFDGDIVSPEYATHQSATWHMWHDRDEQGALRYVVDGRPFVSVVSPAETRWCPVCESDEETYCDGDIRCAMCDHTY